MTSTDPERAKPLEPEVDSRQFARLAIDLGPLLLFFAIFMFAGIYWATGALMIATVASMIVSRAVLGHVSTSLVVTTAMVVLFGAMTFWFQDARFIKMKPTIVNLLFAGLLLAGMLTGRSFLRLLLSHAFELTDAGWRQLTVRWIGFFLAMAAMNEVVWRTFSEATWASFKVFGILPLTIAFMAVQMPLIERHRLKR
jgi:intracellular septation protein